MAEKDYTLAQVGYDAYSISTGGKSTVTGDLLPAFDVLKDETKDAWYAAAQAIAFKAQESSCSTQAAA